MKAADLSHDLKVALAILDEHPEYRSSDWDRAMRLAGSVQRRLESPPVQEPQGSELQHDREPKLTIRGVLDEIDSVLNFRGFRGDRGQPHHGLVNLRHWITERVQDDGQLVSGASEEYAAGGSRGADPAERNTQAPAEAT